MQSGHYSYLSKEVIATLEKRKKRCLVWGIVLCSFFALAAMMSFAEVDPEGTLRQYRWFYVVALALSFLPLLAGIRASITLKRLYRCNAIFEADQDGFVTLKEISAGTHMSQEQTLRMLEKLCSTGAIVNCAFIRSGERPGVSLGGGRTIGFRNVKCPNCGGTTRMRYGTVGVCEYCGSALE